MHIDIIAQPDFLLSKINNHALLHLLTFAEHLAVNNMKSSAKQVDGPQQRLGTE